MATLLSAARLGGEIVRKAIDLHTKGVDVKAVDAIHAAINAAHDIVHEHWTKHQTDKEHV